MSGSKYQAGVKYSNGSRTIIFRYSDADRMYFSENGKRGSLNRSTFCKLKLEPLEPISKGRLQAKPSMPKDHYRKGNNLLYRLNEEA